MKRKGKLAVMTKLQAQLSEIARESALPRMAKGRDSAACTEGTGPRPQAKNNRCRTRPRKRGQNCWDRSSNKADEANNMRLKVTPVCEISNAGRRP